MCNLRPLILLLVISFSPGLASSRADDEVTPKNDAPAEKTEAAGKAEPALAKPTTTVDPAGELLQKLKPEKLGALADMIEEDWSDRPEWAEMALAVMRGQAMQPGQGWWRATDKKYGWTWLKRRFDKNSSNSVELDEFIAAAGTEPHFRQLDRDRDGKVSSSDFDVSVFQSASPTAMRAQLAEFLFFQLDTDTNGQVTKDELGQFFDQADREKLSFLTADDLLGILDSGGAEQKPRESGPTNSDLLKMLFSGQLGWFEEGPKLGEMAPDFQLSTHDKSKTISLSSYKEKKPVVLIFGSFT